MACGCKKNKDESKKGQTQSNVTQTTINETSDKPKLSKDADLKEKIVEKLKKLK